MKTWNTIDKKKWKMRGEWDNEPDKMQWIDEITGLDCLIVRQPSHGSLCGYVGVPEGHPCYERNYDDFSEVFDVHGGLTFSDKCRAHRDEAKGICHSGDVANKDVWWLGFDCAHGGDFSPAYTSFNIPGETYKNVIYVRNEVENLARQIKDYDLHKIT